MLAGGLHRNSLCGAAGGSNDWRVRALVRRGYLVRCRIPNGTPPEIIEMLNGEINSGLLDPKIKAQLADLGERSPADFRKLLTEETEVMRFSGAKAD
jgi:hypothetical protein